MLLPASTRYISPASRILEGVHSRDETPVESDRQLVEACLRGENLAFSCLVERYRHPVYGICLGYTRDFDVAADAAQEAFIASFLKLDGLPDPDRFGPWLKRIAVNQCRMWHRRQRRLVRLSEEEEAALVAPLASPEEELIRKDRRRLVLGAIARLTEPQQQVVVLFYLEDLSLKQIAAFLDLPLQTVNQRLYRARLRLRKETLHMVDATLKDHQLPDDFTEKVVGEALARGERLLAEEDWVVATREFRRITAAVPDHVRAQRGLGLALNGAVQEGLRSEAALDDGELVEETFSSLHRAYQLGARDDDVIQSVAKLSFRFGRHREGGRFLEEAATDCDDWKKEIGLLGRAIAVYYHAQYRDGGADMEACVRCHRRIRALIPVDMGSRAKLAAWKPAGKSLAYAHLGLSEEVFAQLEELREAGGSQWSIDDRFYYTLCHTNQYRETGPWEAMARRGWEFADWARALPADDPCLLAEPIGVDGEPLPSERHKVGEWMRWWTVLYVLNEVIQAEHRDGRDTGRTFDAIEEIVGRHEARWQGLQGGEEADQEKERLSGNYMLGGHSAYHTGRYAECVRFMKRSEELLGRCGAGWEPLHTAASLVVLERLDEAREYLKRIDNRRITSGICRAEFEKCAEFEAMRDDPQTVAIVESWKGAEAAG